MDMKMIVLCRNSAGGPEFHTCTVAASPAQIEEGEHYGLAEENAELNGYEPVMAFDPSDAAAKQMVEIGTWVEGTPTPVVGNSLWIVLHHHRHGQSVVPVYSPTAPEPEQVIIEPYCPNEGETLELLGPYPAVGAKINDSLFGFVEEVAALKKWTPGDTESSECPEPSDGLVDSHQCLLDLIDEARRLRFPGKLPVVHAEKLVNHLEALSAVIDMAGSHLEDIESGIEDGVYLAANNEDLPEKQQALEVMTSVHQALSLATGDESHYLVVVEGDVEPFVIGPYDDSEAVLAAAREQRAQDPDQNNGIYWLDIRNGQPAIGAYSGDFLEINDDD